MSKAVLISIRPKYVEQICSKIKTIEVRKNRPQIETPFKCYIYCTIGNGVKGDYLVPSGIQCGKVIGHFICDDIDTVRVFNDTLYCVKNSQANKLKQMCLTIEEVKAYLGDNNGFNWHISDLKIYNKPRELSEFKKENKCYKKGDLDNIGCWERGCLIQEQGWCDGRFSKITRPPKSYMFIEEN